MGKKRETHLADRTCLIFIYRVEGGGGIFWKVDNSILISLGAGGYEV